MLKLTSKFFGGFLLSWTIMEKAYDISHLEHTNDKYDGLQKIEASGTGDVALKLVSHTHGLTLSRAEEKSYLRRIDLVLMPLMFITFGLQYMDKSLLSAAAQSGIIQDLHLYTIDSQGLNLMRYSYCTMIFYWGYFTGGNSSLLLMKSRSSANP